MAVVGLCQAAVAVLIGPVIDRILSPAPSTEPIALFTIPVVGAAVYLDDLLPASLGDIWTLVAVALAGVFAVKGICDFTANYLVNHAGFSGVRDMRNDVYNVVLNQSPAFFQSKNTGTLIASLVSDIEKVQSAFSHFLADLMRQFFTAAALLFLLVQRDWRLSAASLIVLPLVLLPTARIGKRLRAPRRGVRRTASPNWSRSCMRRFRGTAWSRLLPWSGSRSAASSNSPKNCSARTCGT